MSLFLNAVSLVVNDYDEAIDFYTNKLDFELIEDTRLNDEKRWVLIAPRVAKETRILLAKAASPEQSKSVGNQTGGRVFLFLLALAFVGARLNPECNEGLSRR